MNQKESIFALILSIYTIISAPITFILLWINSDLSTVWNKSKELSKSSLGYDKPDYQYTDVG